MSHWASFANNLFENLLYLMMFSSLAAFEILSLFLSFDSLITCLGTHLWVYPTCCSLSILDLWNHVFYQIWGISSHYFFKYSFWPFSLSASSGPPTVYMLVCLRVFHRSFRLWSLFFSFCSSFTVISRLTFKFADSLLAQVYFWTLLLNFSF